MSSPTDNNNHPASDNPTSPSTDTVQFPNEYLPPSPPPPLQTSESMRRLSALLSAAKLSPTDLITFSYNQASFTAALTASGALTAKAPRPNPTSPQRLSESVRKVYDSPKHFAHEMALIAINNDPQQSKPRGKLTVNGWEQCFVNGRTLDSLRHEMLREKKASPPTAPSRKPDPAEKLLDNKPATIAESDDNKLPTDTSKPTQTAPDQPEQVKPTELATNSSDHPKGTSSSPDRDHKTAPPQIQPPDDKIAPDTTAKPVPSPLEKTDDSTTREKNDTPPAAQSAETKAPKPKSDDASQPAGEATFPKPDKEEARNASATAVPATTDGDEEMPDADRAAEGEVSSDKKDSSIQSAEGDGEQSVPASDKAPEGVAQLSHPETKEERSDDKEDAVASSESEADKEKGRESTPSEVVNESGEATEEISTEEKRTLQKSEDRDEKPASPLAKQETKKRKRADSNDSSPSEKRKRIDSNESSPSVEHTPSRRSQDRGATNRPEWSKKARKLDVPSASEMAPEGLDPDAMEAAAIAAQAEKEEANSRGRRTTRLAAGKIKQVDYKASATAQGSRSLSPGQEFEDVDNSHSNDSGPEPARASRRRNAQGQNAAPPRTSRRVTRKRTSHERDQSSNDDLDHSSPGNGSDGFGDGDSGGHDGMEIDSRYNERGSEGRERKRLRRDGESRRTRQNHADVSDFDPDDRIRHGTRSSTRENSVADGGEILDAHPAEDDNIDAVMEEEQDPEKRTDRYGWTIQDLTRIGDAVAMAQSIEQHDINVELYQAGNWTTDEATNKKVAKYVQDTLSYVGRLKKEILGGETDGRVSVEELRAVIATDLWRLKTGGLETECLQNPRKVLASAEMQEQLKNMLERTRRKLIREVEDLQRDLLVEMEAMRKADLDALYVEVQESTMADYFAREEARLQKLDKEIERYKESETQTRNELDRTKVLVSQLRGETESPGDIGIGKGVGAGGLQVKREDGETEEMQKDGRVIEESIVSEEDGRKKGKPREEASPSERQLEMERLRGLIAAREAEAEGNQRACELETMKFVNLLEAKNRLESELYSYRVSSALSHGGGISGSHGMSSIKSGKDGSRKGENKSGGAGVNKGPSGSRGRVSKGQGPGVSGGSNKGASGSKGKNGGGKNGENKGVKKNKSSGRGQSNGNGERA